VRDLARIGEEGPAADSLRESNTRKKDREYLIQEVEQASGDRQE
jgi:hypothetical protein